MRALIGLIVAALTLAAPLASAHPSSALATAPLANAAMAITHVTVIDVRDGSARPDMTVVVDAGRIVAVAQGLKPPKAAKVLDGRGQFLLPGLWDMHVHLSYAKASALPLFLAYGVTGVRDMGSKLSEVDAWRGQIDAGARPGPRIVRPGPMLNGKSFNPYQLAIGTAEEARVAVRTLKSVGVDFIKVHRRLSREAWLAALDESRKQGLVLVGHVPMEVAPMEASAAGQAMVEHVETLFEGTFAANLSDAQLAPAIADFTRDGRAEQLFAAFAANHTALDPTLVAWASDGRIFDAAGPPDPRSPLIAASGRRTLQLIRPKPDELAAIKGRVALFTPLVRIAHAKGVMLVAGTDTGPTRPPGALLAEELGLLVQAGLTPLEALRTATLNPAIVIGRTQDLGAVGVGKVADLLLLEADPRADIAAVSRLAAVVANGRLYDRAALAALKAQGLREAAEN